MTDRLFSKREIVAHQLVYWAFNVVDPSLVGYQWDESPLEIREEWLAKADIIIGLSTEDCYPRNH